MAIIVPKGTGPQAEKRPEEEKAKAGKVSDVIDIEEEYPVSFTEAAAFLRELADTLERRGAVEMDLASQKVTLNPDEPITLEISFKEDAKKKKLEVEVEIKEHFGASDKEGGRPKVR
ncbi:amphi-Trp domain-containing protein [Methanotrichaceae archaeon M04Ac]|uniref:Amphi-Trp domain-containing protein n=1 Tax=Candidatus Methanocrinis alkalitolerans TaxID=3033395 RepID=A0ABT5XI11_9EURY|nr:amphi-Trp domain-containing protein [Candidatus Methanocrinis alkalitolerans]MCR3883776.1 amphi-Trp domain-containing protein [Methanothrix sp.]MDF0594132.1 amphi-Trp domain-containing protein [Candidatus Methanocrinis alkalitolerans]